MKNKEVKKELEDIAPFLAELKARKKESKDDSIPEGYFEDFRANFFEQLKAETEEAPIQSAKLISLSWRSIAVAASVAVLVISFLASNTFFNADDQANGFADLSMEDMYNYLDDNIEEFEMDELATIVLENEVDDFGIIDVDEDFIDEEYLEDEFLDDFDYEDLL